MRRIRIAQIGISRYTHGRQIWKSLTDQPEVFEIVGYALPENEREKFPQLMEYFDGYQEFTVQEILNNPEIEAVTVETEEIYLTKYAIMAAEHGKHIHMEKPGGTDLSAFERLIETVKRNQIVFHIGYMYRYNPVIMELMTTIKNGKLGKINSVEAYMSCIHTEMTRKWLGVFSGGMMFYLGCHLVDLILQIQGKPQRIIPLSKCSGLDDVTSRDFGMAIFEYPNGISIAKASAVEVGGYARRQLVVSGSKGTVELKPLEMSEGELMYTGKTEYSSGDWSDMGKYTKSELYNRYDGMMAAFAQMVRGEKVNPYTYDYELELYKTLLQCCENTDV